MRTSKRKTKKILKILKIILAIILLISVYINSYLIIKYNVLPIKYLIIYIIIVILIPLFLIYFSLFRRPKSGIRKTITIFEIIYIIILIIVFFYLNQTFDFLSNFSGGLDYETKNYYVIVLDENKYNTLKDLNNKTIGYSKGLDNSMDDAIESLDKKVKLDFQNEEGYQHLFENLKNKTIDSILMVDSIYNLLKEDETNDVTIGTKIIYQFKVKEKVNNISKEVNVTKEPFTIYLSGTDSYDSVTDKAKSDVNIIVSVNPTTHKILLVNIPRDYYVSLNGNGDKDKLTHTGIYGIDTSVKTVEKLLDIDINYYVKVNYNALINLVDALGGVEVYSEYDFTSGYYYIHYNKGYNKVDGKAALEFVRTRKAFIQGDRVRGENQQRMIKAIMDKALSPAILVKYGDMLEAIEGNFITNIDTDSITSMINMQLDKMPKWEIENISLDGTDSYEITYSVPNMELYVMIPKEDSIAVAKDKIKAIKEGI